MIWVTDARTLPDYRLWVHFSDATEGEIDLKDLSPFRFSKQQKESSRALTQIPYVRRTSEYPFRAQIPYAIAWSTLLGKARKDSLQYPLEGYAKKT